MNIITLYNMGVKDFYLAGNNDVTFKTIIRLPKDFREKKGGLTWKQIIERGFLYNAQLAQIADLENQLINLSSTIGKQAAELKRLEEQNFALRMGAG